VQYIKNKSRKECKYIISESNTIDKMSYNEIENEAYKLVAKRDRIKLGMLAFIATRQDKTVALELLSDFILRFMLRTHYDKFDKKEISIYFREAYIMIKFFAPMFKRGNDYEIYLDISQ
jgi:hypothetical protein